jgi:hypothetical protein
MLRPDSTIATALLETGTRQFSMHGLFRDHSFAIRTTRTRYRLLTSIASLPVTTSVTERETVPHHANGSLTSTGQFSISPRRCCSIRATRPLIPSVTIRGRERLDMPSSRVSSSAAQALPGTIGASRFAGRSTTATLTTTISCYLRPACRSRPIARYVRTEQKKPRPRRPGTCLGSDDSVRAIGAGFAQLSGSSFRDRPSDSADCGHRAFSEVGASGADVAGSIGVGGAGDDARCCVDRVGCLDCPSEHFLGSGV